MLSVNGKVGGYVGGHVVDHVISWGWCQKGMQTTFLGDGENDDLNGRTITCSSYKSSKKMMTFSLSQKVGFICK